MLRVTAQTRHILLLIRRVANRHRSCRNRRLRRPVRMTAVAPDRNHPDRHVAFEPAARVSTASAHAGSRMADRKVRFVMNIPETQRPCVQTVFIRRRRRSDYRAVQLRVPAHCYVKSAVAGKQTRLLLHRGVVALHLVLAGADIA
ncbi:hypothetical protein D3C73_1201370 [compost metagenome]